MPPAEGTRRSRRREDRDGLPGARGRTEDATRRPSPRTIPTDLLRTNGAFETGRGPPPRADTRPSAKGRVERRRAVESSRDSSREPRTVRERKGPYPVLSETPPPAHRLDGAYRHRRPRGPTHSRRGRRDSRPGPARPQPAGPRPLAADLGRGTDAGTATWSAWAPDPPAPYRSTPRFRPAHLPRERGPDPRRNSDPTRPSAANGGTAANLPSARPVALPRVSALSGGTGCEAARREAAQGQRVRRGLWSAASTLWTPPGPRPAARAAT